MYLFFDLRNKYFPVPVALENRDLTYQWQLLSLFYFADMKQLCSWQNSELRVFGLKYIQAEPKK
jgi:hypothetical protein